MKNTLGRSLVGIKRFAIVGHHTDGRARTVGPFWAEDEAKRELTRQRRKESGKGWTFQLV